MVSDNTHSHIYVLFLTIFLTGKATNLLDDRLEDVGIIVGMLALNSAYKALKAHTCVDYVHAEWLQMSISLTLILHEYDVPDFDYLRIILVYELTSRHLSLFILST